MSRWMIAFSAVMAVGSLVAVGLSGCSSGATGNATTVMSVGPESSAPALTQEQIDELRTASLEVFAALPIEDDRVLWATTQSLIGRCMGAKGFSYPEEAYPDGPGNIAGMGQLYPDPRLIDEYGYRWVEHQPYSKPPTAPAESIQDEGFQAQLKVCAEETYKEIGREELDRVLEVFYEAASDMSVAVNLSDTVRVTTQNWAECMMQRGHRVTDFRSAEDLASDNGTTDMTSPAAVAVAIADFGCQQQVGFRETQLEARRGLVSEWLDAHPTELLDRQQAIKSVIDRCVALV